MGNEIFTLANELVELRREKEKLEEQLRELDASIKEIEGQLVSEMVNQEVQRFTTDDGTFYLSTRMYVSIAPGREEDLIRWLKSNKLSDFVQEKVKSGSLTGYVKELLEDADKLPEGLRDMVKVYETTAIAIRRKGGKENV